MYWYMLLVKFYYRGMVQQRTAEVTTTRRNYYYYSRRSGVVRLTSNLKSVIQGLVTGNFAPHCLSPPRCINGYRRQNAGRGGDSPAMD